MFKRAAMKVILVSCSIFVGHSAVAQPWPVPLPKGHVVPLCSQLPPLEERFAPVCIRDEAGFIWFGEVHYIDEVADASVSHRCLGRGEEALALVREAFDRGVDVVYGAAVDPRGIPRSIVTLRDTKESVGQLLIDKGLAVPAGTTDC